MVSTEEGACSDVGRAQHGVAEIDAGKYIKTQFAMQPIVFGEKMEKQAVKNNIWCCPTIKTCGILLLATFFLINLTGFIVLWGTSVIENSIIEDMVIRNNTQSYEWWTKPPIEPYMQVRVFNYTNVERFLAGDDEKLSVEEAGPYVYREKLERVKVLFHHNGTVSYQEKRSFEYIPERSVGSLQDLLVVPNMAYLTSVSIMKDSNYFVRLSMSAVFRGLDIQPFLTLPVKDIFWGYNDTLFAMGKSVMVFQGMKSDAREQKIGLLVARNGTSSKRISIHTGADDITQLGVIDRYAGKGSLGIWGSDECNRLDGTDGSMFPPHQIAEDAVLHMYMKDMCRKFPLVFKEYVQTEKGATAMRFHPPRDVFATGDTHPENACYCHQHSASCPPAGVFNSSPCAFNAPLMMSFPHFYLGDPALVDRFEGLDPDPAKHDMFMDIHPKFGFPMAGESRFQVNIMVRRSLGISHLDRFEDETILPIAWFEVVVDDVPPEVDAVLRDLNFATHTVKRIALFSFLATLILVAIVAVRYGLARHANNSKKMRGHC